MTSQQIQHHEFATTDPKKYHPERAAADWLKEIAFQLAVMNERETALDQQLKSAGKVLDGMAQREICPHPYCPVHHPGARIPRTPDFPLDEAIELADKIFSQHLDIEDSELRVQLRELQTLLTRVRKLTIEHSMIRPLDATSEHNRAIAEARILKLEACPFCGHNMKDHPQEVVSQAQPQWSPEGPILAEKPPINK